MVARTTGEVARGRTVVLAAPWVIQGVVAGLAVVMRLVVG